MKYHPRALCPAAALLLAAGAAHAQTELYVAQYQFNNARMMAMGLDGSSPRELFAMAPAQWLPLGMSLWNDQFIWMDSGSGSEIMRAGFDGSGYTVLATPPGFCRGASLDAQGRIYFGSNQHIMRVDADGLNLVTLYTAPSGSPVGAPHVDATNGHVYFGADNAIWRMDLDGSNLKLVVRGVSNPFAVAVDLTGGHVGHIYWVDGDLGTDFVGRANLDDTGYTVLVDNSPNVIQSGSYTDLLVDPVGGKIYWADDIAAQVFSADLDGQNRTPIYTAPAGAAPGGLVLSTGPVIQPIQDCDGNGIPDSVDIANGAPDCDNNGILDSCQVDPCPQRTYLIDQGSDWADTLGRAVGDASRWEVFQPFDVPGGQTWVISGMEVDGYNANYADGSGITAQVFRDNGSGELPDESEVLATTTVHLRFGHRIENWVYSPLSVTLPEGRYWLHLKANNAPTFSASINHGFFGLQSRSRGSSGNFTTFQRPIALRLIQGTACPADWDGSGTVNSTDISAFLTAWLDSLNNQDLNADFDGNGTVNSSDISAFLTAWLQAVTDGC